MDEQLLIDGCKRGEALARKELYELYAPAMMSVCVPVNLVINLWDNPDWNVYVSGGGMIEKGVRSIYHVEAYGLDEHKSATYRSGIDGLQWSLNLSVGVSYRFYRDWSLYLEPRYSYYFNNNQLVSYRTENMTLIGVGAGVRFEF